MSRRPRNLVKRSDRPGYYYRWTDGGRVRWLSLGTDYDEAVRKLRKLQRQEVPTREITVKEAATQWLGSYIPTTRNEKGQQLALRRVERYLTPAMGHYLVSRLAVTHVVTRTFKGPWARTSCTHGSATS